MWVREIAGYGFWGGYGQGVPLPQHIFCQKVPFWPFVAYITVNRGHGTEKIWGVGTPSPRGTNPPLNFFAF